MLYDPSSAAELPLRVHLAAQGDWKPLAETASSNSQGITSMSQGYFLSITCSEDLPFIRDEEIPAAVAGTFLGDLRIRKQREACAGWTAAKIPESFLAPVTSDVPALVIAGERDTASPSDAGGRSHPAQRKYVLIPDAGHGRGGFKGQDCITALQVKTVEDGAVDRLDTSCVAKMERPAFVLSLGDPEVAVSRADLKALVGRYAGKEESVKIDLPGERLRLSLGSKAFLLVPTAATRFRPDGLPAGYAVRFERGGKGPARAMILVQPGEPDERMTRNLRKTTQDLRDGRDEETPDLVPGVPASCLPSLWAVSRCAGMSRRALSPFAANRSSCATGDYSWCCRTQCPRPPQPVPPPPVPPPPCPRSRCRLSRLSSCVLAPPWRDAFVAEGIVGFT